MKCPICGEEVAGDPIAHIKTQSHEAALEKLLQSEQATFPKKHAPADQKKYHPNQKRLTCSNCG